jgi:hypothetical protein
VSLTLGFLGLVVLTGLSGHDSKGSFSYMPLSEGIIDLTTIFNFILFVLNACISYHLIMDEVPIKNDHVVENQKSDISMSVIPCIKTELKYSKNVNQTETKQVANDMGKLVSFQPHINKCMRSYAEVAKDSNKEERDMGKKYPLIDVYPKVKM